MLPELFYKRDILPKVEKTKETEQQAPNTHINNSTIVFSVYEPDLCQTQKENQCQLFRPFSWPK